MTDDTDDNHIDDVFQFISKHQQVLPPSEKAPKGAYKSRYGIVALKKGFNKEEVAEEFKALIAKNHEGYYHNMNPLDGEIHMYMELGGWLGSDQAGLNFMGFSTLLGLTDFQEDLLMIQAKSPSKTVTEAPDPTHVKGGPKIDAKKERSRE